MTILVMYTKACIRTGVKRRRQAPATARSPRGEGEGSVAETNVSDQPLSAEELAVVSADFESAPASAVIRWAVETFGDSLVLAASFEDIVLIDLVTKVAPAHRGRLLGHGGPLSRDVGLRRRYAGALRPQPHRDEARARGGRLPLWLRPVLPVPQGGAAAACPRREAGVADVAQALGRPDPRRRADRELGRRVRAGEGQPARDVDRGRHFVLPGRPRAACAPAHSAGLPLHRLRADDASRWPRGRTPAPGVGRAPTSPSAACTSSAT